MTNLEKALATVARLVNEHNYPLASAITSAVTVTPGVSSTELRAALAKEATK